MTRLHDLAAVRVAKRLAKPLLAGLGYEVRRAKDSGRESFFGQATAIDRAHRAQTGESVEALRQKYREPVFGEVTPWTLFERLAHCIDPTDGALGCVSQEIHVLQVLEAMEAESVRDEALLLTALLHDLGKLLLLTGEAPENVVCLNSPIGRGIRGAGLDRQVLQWNHDEFVYARFKDLVPEPVAWLLRYHSIRLEDCTPLMDARDRDYTDRYLRPFQRYDQGSKSQYRLPKRRLEQYAGLLEKALPPTIVF